MIDSYLFKSLEVEEVIATLPYILHPDAENPIYIFKDCEDITNLDVKRSFRYFGILNIPQLKGLDLYIGHITEKTKNNQIFVRGVVFTNDRNKIAIFHRAPNALNHDDYTLMLRENNTLLYRSGVIPGKGYRFNIENHLIIPGEKYTPFKLNSSSIETGLEKMPSNVRLAEILAGLNPNFQ